MSSKKLDPDNTGVVNDMKSAIEKVVSTKSVVLVEFDPTMKMGH